MDEARATYKAWWNMIDRCANPDSASWKDYGGRGIRVCERWRDYEAFAADMGLPSVLARQIGGQGSGKSARKRFFRISLTIMPRGGIFNP